MPVLFQRLLHQHSIWHILKEWKRYKTFFKLSSNCIENAAAGFPAHKGMAYCFRTFFLKMEPKESINSLQHVLITTDEVARTA